MHNRWHKLTLLTLVLLVTALLAACGGAEDVPSGTTGDGEDNAGDNAADNTAEATDEAAAEDEKLAAIQARGTLLVSTDPAYPPQSELVEGGERPADTKCASDQLTGAELRGFDISTAVEIAERLGVEACFVTPAWDLITAGNWADRWDLSVGSMTITPERMVNLYFTQPYYTYPAAFFVHTDNTTFQAPTDLSGATIGVCQGCTYEQYLMGSLTIPGVTIDPMVENAEIVTYDTDTTALEDLVLGDGVRLDAVLTALPVGQGYIEDGRPIKQLGSAVYYEYLAAAVDRHSSQDVTAFVDRLNEIIQEMHADGTLLALSQEFYGLDYTSAAAEFDLANLGQE